MKSPYERLNYFYLHNIPFLPLTVRGMSVNCRIGQSKQLVFVPLKYFNKTEEGLDLKENVDLEWFYNKRDTQIKIKHYLEEVGE